MKDIDKSNATPAPGKPAPEQEKWLSKDGIVDVPKRTAAPDPADTAQEAVHQVMPKKDVPKAVPPGPTKLPPTAAQVAPDQMSKQQQGSMPGVDEIEGGKS